MCFGSAVAVWKPVKCPFTHSFLHVCPVNTSDLLPLLVYNHCAFSSGALHHRSKGRHRRLRKSVLMMSVHRPFTVKYLREELRITALSPAVSTQKRQPSEQPSVSGPHPRLVSCYIGRAVSSRCFLHLLYLPSFYKLSLCFSFESQIIIVAFIFSGCKKKSG